MSDILFFLFLIGSVAVAGYIIVYLFFHKAIKLRKLPSAACAVILVSVFMYQWYQNIMDNFFQNLP